MFVKSRLLIGNTVLLVGVKKKLKETKKIKEKKKQKIRKSARKQTNKKKLKKYKADMIVRMSVVLNRTVVDSN